MKVIISLVLSLVSLSVHAQDTTKTEFDGHKWEAPYHFPIPKDWTIERFLIPISFAPQIPYKGVEDIRFTPGWGNVKTDEYWTYAFLWYLDDSPETNAKIIADNLQAYYTGLININRENYKVPVEKLIPVVTSFKEIPTDRGDLQTFTGTIKMLDYMQQQPITLNCKAHLKTCPGENKTLLFYEISPKSFTHKNWQSLNQLWIDFTCKKVDTLNK
jgi:hypothetical protein